MIAIDNACEFYSLWVGIPSIPDVESTFALELKEWNEANIKARRTNDDVKFMQLPIFGSYAAINDLCDAGKVNGGIVGDESFQEASPYDCCQISLYQMSVFQSTWCGPSTTNSPGGDDVLLDLVVAM
jgi:hypothetical protein